MKCILILMSAISLNVSANKMTMETCEVIHKLSTTIMQKRQEGVSIIEMLKVSENDFSKNIILAAYKKPRYSTERNQNESIEDFANDVFLECLELIK